MPLSPAATLDQIDTIAIERSSPLLPRLGRILAEHRRRRLDRKAAEAILLLDHPGVAEDFRVACRR